MDLLNKKGKIFLTGIGGIGMSGIAEILHNLGYEVSGSDIKDGSNVRRLKKIGIKIKIGHNENNVIGISLLVYSSAIKPNNKELKKARSLGIPLVSRSEMLAELMRMKKTITVAGSHGKTSTISIISEIFFTSKLDPTVINGGIINSFGSNTRLGSSEWMIVETDESDGSFVNLPSFCGLITSIDDEHIDYYKNIKNLEKAFEEYINNTSIFGFSAICSDDKTAFKLAKKQNRANIVFYGTNKSANYRAKNIRIKNNGQFFDVEIKHINKKNKIYRNIFFPMHGKHNLNNALGAITLSHKLGIDFQSIKKALENFQGVKRRLTLISEYKGICFYDDYAHHPSEIRATLQALKELRMKRIITVIQPHRYSRIKHTFHNYKKSFVDSDLTVVLPVYAAGEKPINKYNSKFIVKSIKEQSKNLAYKFDDFLSVESFLLKEIKRGDLVVFMGAGSISGWANNFISKLSKPNE